MKACKTSVILVRPGLVQTLDVVVNGKFKKGIDLLQTEHMQQNLEQYVNNSLPRHKGASSSRAGLEQLGKKYVSIKT